jgi:hypothetical protein
VRGVFERVNIVGDSLEEDVLEIGVLGDLVNLLQKLGEAAGFVTRGVICMGVVDEVMVRYFEFITEFFTVAVVNRFACFRSGFLAVCVDVASD